VERPSWTDERLDDLAEAMRSGFARVDQDIRDVRTELEGVRQTMLRVGAAMMGTMTVGFVSVLAAILARGA